MQRLSTRSNTKSNYNMVQCKKHPKHKQSPGVCSLCLGEKLSRVSSTCSRGQQMASRARAYYYCSSSSVSSSEDESSYVSSCASPALHHEDEGRHRRIDSNVNLNIVKYLCKSKSMAFGEVEENNKKKVVGGFWSKLLRPRRKNNINHHHHFANNVKNNNPLFVNHKVYMSQPLDVPSSSTMVVCNGN
ncbi:hypothetical protein vseg_009177 [Gypsophila vaccaria]